MACYRPLRAWRERRKGADGKRRVAFSRREVRGWAEEIPILCGQCIGCRLERSRQWAVRCMHEAASYAENSFVTLTYRPEALPEGGTLVKRHFQLFMKRLRKFFRSERISFFHCGEYGEQLSRPHYHALLFGVGFPDQTFYKKAGDGSPLFRSACLDRLWGHGDCLIGAVTFESAAYCARYCVAKVTGPEAPGWYMHVDPDTGEIFDRLPEYVTMSRRPAIGERWYEEFGAEVRKHDSVVVRGVEAKPPRFYDKLHEELDQVAYELTKAERVAAAKTKVAKANSTPERLAVREVVKKAQVNSLRRSL